MGGKALNIETERKNTKEFIRISSEIKEILESNIGVLTHIVRYYHNKIDHGDIDILLRIDNKFKNKNKDLKTIVLELFSPNDIHNNGSVISFDYENIQIDLIPISESNWETAKCYFDYDPSGNLMGKIAHSFGLKYGFKGLEYPLRTGSGRIAENINISKDNKKIFEFLGYDYNEYLKGFDEIKEIFDFIINGKYFNPYRFQFDNLTRIDRKRNKKRKTYNEFLSYINEYINEFKNYYEFDKNKDNYLTWINDFFPEVKLIDKIKEFKIKDQQNQEISKKFNGYLIMQRHPNLKGKELGNKIGQFKKQFENWKDFALNETSEEILNKFDEFINKNE